MNRNSWIWSIGKYKMLGVDDSSVFLWKEIRCTAHRAKGKKEGGIDGWDTLMNWNGCLKIGLSWVKTNFLVGPAWGELRMAWWERLSSIILQGESFFLLERYLCLNGRKEWWIRCSFWWWMPLGRNRWRGVLSFWHLFIQKENWSRILILQKGTPRN